MKYLIQPKINGEYLKVGLGRFLPVFPELVKNDPWWTDAKLDPQRPPYVHQAFVASTTPLFFAYNPAYARVETEHVWGQAMADIMANGMAPQAATDKAFRRLDEIFAQYPIHQA